MDGNKNNSRVFLKGWEWLESRSVVERAIDSASSIQNGRLGRPGRKGCVAVSDTNGGFVCLTANETSGGRTWDHQVIRSASRRPEAIAQSAP